MQTGSRPFSSSLRRRKRRLCISWYTRQNPLIHLRLRTLHHLVLSQYSAADCGKCRGIRDISVIGKGGNAKESSNSQVIPFIRLKSLTICPACSCYSPHLTVVGPVGSSQRSALREGHLVDSTPAFIEHTEITVVFMGGIS